jgi:3-demethoxyubiquinol 3-hydroxylase
MRIMWVRELHGFLNMRNLSGSDRLLSAAGRLPLILGNLSPAGEVAVALGPSGGEVLPLNEQERALSGALMRVNHVGEVCAQALYEAQALVTQDAELRAQLLQAAQEERRHLAWVQTRLDQLGARPSLLNPLWFGGAFSLGLVAGLAGDKTSLGFVAETERQVEAHLAGHLTRLPARDLASREIVEKMRAEEEAHGQWAIQRGGVALLWPVRAVMRLGAKLMTTIAHYI